jgi:hypothetical protein
VMESEVGLRVFDRRVVLTRTANHLRLKPGDMPECYGIERRRTVSAGESADQGD